MRMTKKLLSLILTGVLAFTLCSCGAAKEGAIDDQAGYRDAMEGLQETIIDDELLALAGSASSSQACLDACSAVFNLLNQQRVARGLSELVWSDALTNAARVRASEIISSFSHTRPDGSEFWTVDSSVQYGENLAKLYQSADTVFVAWMNSPTHAANMMDSGYKTVGIAIAQADDGNWYWAQEFGYN